MVGAAVVRAIATRCAMVAPEQLALERTTAPDGSRPITDIGLRNTYPGAVSGTRRRARILSIPLALLAACSSGGPTSDDVLVEDTLPPGEPVRSVAVEPLAVDGLGRAVAAHLGDDGALVTATTTGVHRWIPDSGEVRVAVSFEPGGRPTRVAISPSGEEVAVVTGDHQSVRVYSSESGIVTRTWSAPLGAAVSDLWFEPQTDRLVLETSAGPVLVDADGAVSVDATARPLPTGRLGALPDGTIVGAVLGTSELLVIAANDVERHRLELREGERIEDVRVSPHEGRIGVSVSSGEDEFEKVHRVLFLDTSLAVIGSIDTGLRLGAESWTLANDRLFVANDTELIAWSTNGIEMGRAETQAPVVGMHVVGDEVVVVGRDGSIDRWNGDSNPVPVSSGAVTAVFHTVDAQAGSITTVDLFGLVNVRRAVDGQLLHTADVFAVGELTSLALSADGSALAAGSTVGNVRVLDADLSPQHDVPAASYGVRVDAVGFDPRSGDLVTGLSERLSTEAFDDSVTGWSNEFSERFRALGDVADVPGCAYFNARLRFDPSGTLLAAATHHFGVAMLDPETGEELDELPGAATILDIAFSPDGAVLVVTHDDGVVDVWDVVDRSLLATYRPAQPGLGAIAILQEGDAMLVADLTGTISLLDLMTGEPLLVFDGVVDRTRSIAVNSDGTVVAAPKPDGTIGLWSTDSGAQVGVAEGHMGTVTALTFGGDGTRLYSASDDGTVRSWSIAIEA
jgi:WD40 repeat protein